MDIKEEIGRLVLEALHRAHPGVELPAPQITLPKQKEQGDYAAVLFPVASKLRVRPQDLTAALVTELAANPLFESVTPAAGFLNFRIRPAAICGMAVRSVLEGTPRFGDSQRHRNASVMVEYSSPNTNKPLHLGHVRNNVLGMALANLFDAVGYRVHPVCLVNDRGIHICKSMVAYRRFGQGQTPESTGEKGDHMVGRFYVEFDKALKAEYQAWAEGPGREQAEKWGEEAQQRYFNEHSELGAEAREMLRRWEEGDPEVLALWKTMNGWVYDGFGETYHKLGSRFEKIYYESQTFKLGNRVVDEGLQKGIFQQAEDGSVSIDLSDANLGRKVLRRRDGTSVYMTQDLGTAIHKFEDFGMDLSVYVVGSEQNHHFQVLFEILRRLGYPWAKHGLYHMSYGMVYLPTGKMKSREGTVVDADDLVAELTEAVRNIIRSGEQIRVPAEDIESTAQKVALGALKFYMLNVTPTQDMNFDPEKSVSLKGDTGVAVQYAAARIRSIEENVGDLATVEPDLTLLVEPEAVEIAKLLLDWPRVVERAAEERNPALVGQALLDLRRAFSDGYRALRVLEGDGPVEDRPELAAARLALFRATRSVLVRGLELLGIEAPARM